MREFLREANLDRFATQLKNLLRSGTDFLFPSICHVCEIELPSTYENNFCKDCLSEIVQLDANRCQLCSAIVGPHLLTETGCFFCKDDSFAFTRVATLGTYEELLKQAILKGKVGHDAVMLQSLSYLTIETFSDRIDAMQSDLIIPIPHHWRDRLARSSQASNTIANHISRCLNTKCDQTLLKKLKRTAKQHSLTPAERRKNLRSTFHVAQHSNLSGRRILLVDDVITTGTTCHRATQELLKAGAKEVNVFAIGRGIGA